MTTDVCIFLHSFADGGAEKVAVQLANSMIDNGMTVSVVVKKDEGPWREVLNTRVPVIALGGRYRWLIFKIVRFLKSYQTKAIISFITDLNIMVLIAVALSGWRGRLVVSERSSLQSWYWRWGYWKTRVLKVLMSALYPRADRIVAVSQQLAGDLILQLNLPSEKVVAIPNPLNVEEIRREAITLVPHRFFSEGVPVVISVGRLHILKNFSTLIRAVADLSVRVDVRLILLGEGPLRFELEELVDLLGLSKVVDLPGFVYPPWPWIARADLFALSSRAEGWPNALVEALALGVPVVATDCPTGPREILDGGRFGRLVPVGDVKAMSAAIEATLSNSPDRAALHRRAEEWSIERALDSYLSCIHG